MRNFFAFFVIAVAIMFTVACEKNDNNKTDNSAVVDDDNNVDDNVVVDDDNNVPDNDNTAHSVTYNGMAMKGPFYAGGNVTVFACDENGIQTGEAYTSHIENATGNFTLDAEVSGTVIVKAEGVYFNEIYNESSTGTVRVEAVFNATGSGTQNAFLNPISHIISYCKLKKIQSGDADDVAEIACATLLFDELSLPKPTPFTVETLRDIQYPYPIAFSCGISQAAKLIAEYDKSKFDTELQRILDQAKIELATDALSEGTKIIFRNGFATLDAEVCRSNLQTYLDTETEGIIIPPLGEALDTDGDGIPDSIDPDNDGDGVENGLDCVVGKTTFKNITLQDSYFCAQQEDTTWGCKNFLSYTDVGVDTSSWNHAFTKTVSGDYFVCGLETSKIWCWYDGNIIPAMKQIGDQDWGDIFAGKNRLCAISSTDNLLYCWGENWQINTDVEPTKISDDIWKTVSLKNEKIWGIKSNNTIWNWNDGGIPSVVSDAEWLSFSEGSLYGIKNDGTLWYFGEELSPIQIENDTDWKMITGTCAVKTDNNTWCWNENSSSPAQKIGFGWSCGEWSYLSNASSFKTNYCGIKTDGSLWCYEGDTISNYSGTD